MAALEHLKQEFERFSHGLNGQKELPVHQLRVDAMEAFLGMGFPTRKHEEWKYTPVLNFTKDELSLADSSTQDPGEIDRLENLDGYKLVIVNGDLREDLSDQVDGIEVMPLSKAFKERADIVEKHYNKAARNESEAFTAWNTAFANQGIFMHAKQNAALDKPIYLLYVSTGNNKQWINSRSLIVAETGSQFDFVEHFQDLSDNVSDFYNHHTEIFVEGNARVRQTRIQEDLPEFNFVGTIEVEQRRDSFYQCYTLSLGGELTRNNVHVAFNDENCEADLRGIYIPKNNELIDNHLLIDHRKPNCLSNQLYKGILGRPR